MPAPSLTTITGTVYDAHGQPAAGRSLYLKHVLLNGVLQPTGPVMTANIDRPIGGDATVRYVEEFISNASGVISFTVPQLSTVYLEGNVSGYNNGEVALSIPATATASLESLTPATFPINVTTFTFLSLVDTPDDFTGDALKWARVNAGETALEFFAPTGTPDGTKFLRDDLSWQTAGSIVTAEVVQDALVNFFPDVAPFDWTYDDAGDRVTLAILDATASARGLMSTAYAARLDQLEVGDAPTFAGANLNGTYGTQLTLGASGQGGRIDFKRGSDGTNLGWLGYTTAGGATDVGWVGTVMTVQAVSTFRLLSGNSFDALFASATGLVGINKTSSIAAQLHTLSNAIGVIPFIAEGPAGLTAIIGDFRVNGVSKASVSAAGLITAASQVVSQSGGFQSPVAGYFYWTGRCNITSPADGVVRLTNSTEASFTSLQLGLGTALFPMWKRSATIVQGRLGDDADFCPIQGKLRSHANVTAETPTATHTLRLFDAAGTEYKVLCVAA